MSNDLYRALGGQQSASDGGFADMIKQIQQFRSSYRGDARAEVQRLLNSGEMSQDQLNKYTQMARQIMQYMR